MLLPNFKFENELWNKGYMYVAGCDEVGRGSFAGPVVAGCAIFPSNFKYRKLKNLKIDDSKRLTARQREIADIWIKKNSLSWGIGESSVSEINKHGLGKAANMAFRRAIKKTNLKIDYLLIDAFYIPKVLGLPKTKQLLIINGDQKSFSIAAASIIAKVYRDKLMQKIGKNKMHRKYRWHLNKGYGTKFHREIILKYGITKYHRKAFIETYFKKIEVKEITY